MFAVWCRIGRVPQTKGLGTTHSYFLKRRRTSPRILEGDVDVLQKSEMPDQFERDVQFPVSISEFYRYGGHGSEWGWWLRWSKRAIGRQVRKRKGRLRAGLVVVEIGGRLLGRRCLVWDWGGFFTGWERNQTPVRPAHPRRLTRGTGGEAAKAVPLH